MSLTSDHEADVARGAAHCAEVRTRLAARTPEERAADDASVRALVASWPRIRELVAAAAARCEVDVSRWEGEGGR